LRCIKRLTRTFSTLDIPHYFAHTLGAQPKYDPKKPPAERGSISGEYSNDELSKVFESFIQEFVLCVQCRLPEYRYEPTPKRVRRARVALSLTRFVLTRRVPGCTSCRSALSAKVAA